MPALKLLTKLRKAPRIVKVMLAQQFFEGFVPIMALYAIMFERVGHLSFDQIGWLFSIWSLAFVVAELPSGVLADYWSRRKVIIIGGVLRALGLAIWIVWPGFIGYAIGFALWGVMIACTSGSVSAYLHNELRATGKGASYAKYYGWVMALHWLGTLIGYLVAAAFTLQHTTLLISLSIMSSMVTAAMLFFTPESPYKKRDTYLKTLKAGMQEVIQSKKLQFLCLVLFTVFMIIGVLEELLPRTYAIFGLGDGAVSLALALSLLLTIIVIARLESYVHFSLRKQVLAMVAGIVLLLAGLWVGGMGGTLLVIAFSLVFQLFRPLFMHHVQETVAGDERATVASIPGLAAGLLGALGYVIIGAGAAVSSETVSIGAYGIFWLAVLLGLAYGAKRYALGSPQHSPPTPANDNYSITAP